MASFFISHREKTAEYNAADLVNVTLSSGGDDLEKTGGSDGVWDAGAFGNQKLFFGGVKFNAGQVDKACVCGLSSVDTDQDFDTIEFGINMQNDGQISAVENGSIAWSTGVVYDTNTVLSVEVNDSGAVEYKKDGVVQYTSLVTPTFPLYMDCSIYNSAAAIIDLTLTPGKTITIPGLEAYPSRRPIEFLQGRQETPGGVVKIGDLGPQIQFVNLITNPLIQANKDILEDFVLNFANGGVNFFDFTDGKSIEWDKLRFVLNTLDLIRGDADLFTEELLMRQDVA